MSSVCEHGNLGRVCLVCEVTQERDEARAALAAVQAELAAEREKHDEEAYNDAMSALAAAQVEVARLNAVVAALEGAMNPQDAADAHEQFGRRMAETMAAEHGHARMDDTATQLTEARRVLREVQWICPICSGMHTRGHRSDCALAAMLREEGTP